MAVSIATINVNGLRDCNKRMGFLHWLSHLSLDIVCLQEVHVLTSAEGSSWFDSFGYRSFVSPGSNHARGTVILFRPTFSLSGSFCDTEGRFVLCDFSFRGKFFRVASLYAPNVNPDRNNFFSFVLAKIDPSVHTFLCGDFNSVFDRSLDRWGSCPFDYSRESSALLSGLFRDCCVLDAWRLSHPTAKSFTWSKPDGSISSRIDLIGVPFAWAPFISSCSICPCPFSDHSIVSLSLSIPEVIPRGPGRWKLNTSLLADDLFCVEVRNFWRSWQRRKGLFSSLSKWWDIGKRKIKRIAIYFGSIKKRDRATSRSLLTALATHLKNRIDDGMMSCFDVYQSTLLKLAELEQAEALSAKVRSRVRWAEEGETSSSFFFRLERKNGSTGWISAIRADDGTIAVDKDGISAAWLSFYSALFTAEPTDSVVQAEMLDMFGSLLPSSEVPQCEGLFSTHEVFTALQGMAKNKSPGSDGLPVEFYWAFWDVLGEDLVSVLNASYNTGCLPSSLRKGLISLSFKKGDRLDRKNWRPITLLNVDYKLCARSLAGRLLRVIHHVVDVNQTCGVPGRFIGENVSLLRDLVSYTSESNIPAAILSLDQEKAFDRVDWAFMFRTLQRMGFGPSFIRWVRLLYCNVRSSVLFNGYSTPVFFPSRGVRQGCPLSPLLYILTMEVLAVNLRGHPHICGILLPGVPSPLPVVSLYADDTSAIVNSDSGIKAVFEVYSRFEKASGSKLNLEKCKGLWLGAWRARTDSPVNIDWSELMIKVLGVFIGFGDLDLANWRPRIDSVTKCLASWSIRSLSFSGRALVANALALSRIWYVASLVHMPHWVLRELNTLLFNFFWAGKKDKVSRKVVVQPRDCGGFAVVAIDLKVQALLIQWVKRFAASPSAWVSLLTYWCFDRFGVDPVTLLSTPFNFALRRLPPFYAAVLRAWRAIGGSVAPSGPPSISGPSGVRVLVSAVTCKSTYARLLDLSHVVPHCVGKFRPVFGDLYWSSTWSQLFFMPLDRKVIDLAWKVSHGALLTMDRLLSFGYGLPAACFCGFHLESAEHLFFHCPLAKSGIDWIQSLLFCAAPLSPPIVLRHVLFGFSPDELLVVPRVFVYLLHSLKFLVWSQRNDCRFRSYRPGAIALLAALKARLRFYLPLFFKRFVSSRRKRYFLRQWGASGVVCSTSRGELVFHL